MINPLDYDRLSVGGDSSCESLTNGDPHRLLDLFLQTLRRSRDELVRSLVKQEHCRRVGVEDFAHPNKQLVQQIIRGEMRKRDVRDDEQSSKPFRCVVGLKGWRLHDSLSPDGTSNCIPSCTHTGTGAGPNRPNRPGPRAGQEMRAAEDGADRPHPMNGAWGSNRVWGAGGPHPNASPRDSSRWLTERITGNRAPDRSRGGRTLWAVSSGCCGEGEAFRSCLPGS